MNRNLPREKELVLYSIVLKENKNPCILNRLFEKLRDPLLHRWYSASKRYRYTTVFQPEMKDDCTVGVVTPFTRSRTEKVCGSIQGSHCRPRARWGAQDPIAVAEINSAVLPPCIPALLPACFPSLGWRFPQLPQRIQYLFRKLSFFAQTGMRAETGDRKSRTTLSELYRNECGHRNH